MARDEPPLIADPGDGGTINAPWSGDCELVVGSANETREVARPERRGRLLLTHASGNKRITVHFQDPITTKGHTRIQFKKAGGVAQFRATEIDIDDDGETVRRLVWRVIERDDARLKA